MPQTTLVDPYVLVLNTDKQIPSSSNGVAQSDLIWNNDFPIVRLDYEAGSLQYLYELSCTFTGLDQTYIGQVIENPNRQQFGSYCFEREGFVEAGSREILQYKKTRIIWRSERYLLSSNQASRPKNMQLGAKPILETWPTEVIPLQTYGQVEPVPLTGRSVGSENAWGGLITEGGNLKYAWNTESDAEIAITKRFPVIPTSPLETTIAREKLRFVVDKADIVFNEKESRYRNNQDLGIMKLGRERNKILFTLYQGVGANLTFKIYQCGLYRNVTALPVYPDPPPTGGGGGNTG
jgi:hypothetical protein